MGLRCSSRAIWKAYSFNWRPLGGKVATRQIFIGSRFKTELMLKYGLNC